MGRQPQGAVLADAAYYRSELLDRLGLDDSASDGEIERAHSDLSEFLDTAPHQVRDWASARAAEADEALVLLSGPAEHLRASAPARTSAPAAPARTAPSFDQPVVTRAAVLAAFRPRSSKTWWVVVPVVMAAVIFGVYRWGGGSAVPPVTGTPTNTSAPTPTDQAQGAKPLDQAKVADLMKKIAADPKDVTALAGLGDAYFAAADYKTAALWETKILDVDATNKSALLALGAAQFNQGDAATAKTTWIKAAFLYPKDAEVHYDLGFLYLSQAKPDMAKVRTEWNKVVEIDPTSAVAKTVSEHLKSLDKQAPGASGSPAPSATTDEKTN